MYRVEWDDEERHHMVDDFDSLSKAAEQAAALSVAGTEFEVFRTLNDLEAEEFNVCFQQSAPVAMQRHKAGQQIESLAFALAHVNGQIERHIREVDILVLTPETLIERQKLVRDLRTKGQEIAKQIRELKQGL